MKEHRNLKMQAPDIQNLPQWTLQWLSYFKVALSLTSSSFSSKYWSHCSGTTSLKPSRKALVWASTPRVNLHSAIRLHGGVGGGGKRVVKASATAFRSKPWQIRRRSGSVRSGTVCSCIASRCSTCKTSGQSIPAFNCNLFYYYDILQTD